MGATEPAGQGWGEDAPRGGWMLSGSISCHPCPVPGRRGGLLPRVPGCLREMLPGLAGRYRRPSAATSCPSRRWHAGRDHEGPALPGACTKPREPRWVDGKLPAAFRLETAISLRLWQWCLCMQGQRGCQSSWVILLGADLSHCIFPVSTMQWSHFLLQFVLSGYLGHLDPPAKEWPTPTSWRHPASSNCRRRQAFWPLLSIPGGRAAAGSGGQDSSPSFPSPQFVAAPSSAGLPSRLWAARLGLERLRRVCHACCARAVCWQTGSGWVGCPAAGQPTVTC